MIVISSQYLFFKSYAGFAAIATIVCMSNPQANGCMEMKALSFLLTGWKVSQFIVVVWGASRIWWPRSGGELFQRAQKKRRDKVKVANEIYKSEITWLLYRAEHRARR